MTYVILDVILWYFTGVPGLLLFFYSKKEIKCLLKWKQLFLEQ